MSYRMKVFLTSVILLAQVISNTGCAAGWFLAGAGATAAVVVVSNEHEKQESADEEASVE